MTHLEAYSGHPRADNRGSHFHLPTEKKTLAGISKEKAFQIAENQVMHYLLERVLMVDHPYLFSEAEEIAFSYKYIQTTNIDGEEVLMTEGYKDQTILTQLCARPHEIRLQELANKMTINPSYRRTEKEIRVLKRTEAEMSGAINFQKMVVDAPDNSFFIWTSPPGKREDDYWDLSITHLAQVKPADSAGQREVVCWRCVHSLDLDQHMKFLNLFLPEDHPLPKQATAEDIILRPACLTPDQAELQGFQTIHDLISFLYEKSNQNLNKEEIAIQLKKIERLKIILAPEIERLAYFLQRGLLTESGEQLDLIEQIALANFLYEDRSNEFVFRAWLDRREEMHQQGGSCPAAFISDLTSAISSGSKEGKEDKEGGKEEKYHLCPQCGGIRRFHQGVCVDCGYKRV